MISTAKFFNSIHHEIYPVHWYDIFWLSLSYFHSLKFKPMLLITVILRNDGACCLAIIFGVAILVTLHSFRWRNNGRDGVSNHQPHYCLLNRLFRRRSKKTSKLRVTGLLREIHRWPVNSPHKWPVTRKTFPFDDVIMLYVATSATHWRLGARQWNLRMTIIKWVVGNGRHGVMPYSLPMGHRLFR